VEPRMILVLREIRHRDLPRLYPACLQKTIVRFIICIQYRGRAFFDD